MFGLFSLPKLLLLGAIICAVWYGFNWLNRRQNQLKHTDRNAPSSNKKRAESGSSEPDIEEMVACPDCGAYVAKGSRHRCG